jgi:hypothetical protein
MLLAKLLANLVTVTPNFAIDVHIFLANNVAK